VKIGFKFQSLGKISNISTSDPPPQLILGQFQHWIQLFITVPMFSNCLLLISFLLLHAPWSLTLDCKYMYTILLMLLAETQCGRL